MINENNQLFFSDKIEYDYEFDYNIKLNNQNYRKYLKIENQLSFDEFCIFFKNNETQINDEINSIKKEYLYKSNMHGFNHNVKVLIFGFYLTKKYNLDSIDTRIILDACKYHDIGRINDLYDEKHGLNSAKKIGEVVDAKIYETEENINILKAIVEFHSIPDKMIFKVIKKYGVDIERFKLLAFILKDVDGLDRVRTSINNKTFSDLNPKYLRLEESKKLVKISHIINYIFSKRVK